MKIEETVEDAGEDAALGSGITSREIDEDSVVEETKDKEITEDK